MIDFKIIPEPGSHSLADCPVFNSMEYCRISDLQNRHILIIECLLNSEKLIFPFEIIESKLLTFGRFLYQPTYIDGRMPSKAQELEILNCSTQYSQSFSIISDRSNILPIRFIPNRPTTFNRNFVEEPTPQA